MNFLTKLPNEHYIANVILSEVDGVPVDSEVPIMTL